MNSASKSGLVVGLPKLCFDGGENLEAYAKLRREHHRTTEDTSQDASLIGSDLLSTVSK
ncbi:MAG: hypothetical protein ACI9KE_002789 [Polyangiales bacterium]|jgi:hypothetical protein